MIYLDPAPQYAERESKGQLLLVLLKETQFEQEMEVYLDPAPQDAER